MKNIKTRKLLQCSLKPMVVAIAMASALPAHAVRFDIGDIEGQFDSSISIGSSWATASPDKDLIWANNGGNANAANTDDNRLNFDKGGNANAANTDDNRQNRLRALLRAWDPQ